MLLFKTSGATFAGVIRHQAHAFRGVPSEWAAGELVLVSKNRRDLRPEERQIQYTMRLHDVRILQPGEASRYWAGTEGRWTHLFVCGDTKAISRPFDLVEVIGD